MTVEKVAWYDTENWEKEYLESKNYPFNIKFIEEKLDKNTAGKAEDCDAVSVFVSSRLDEEVIERLDVDIIGCRSTGFDHVDIEKASDKGIDVCNVPDYGANTVAEHTFGLLLTVSRRIYEAVDKVERGEFDHNGLKGFDLKGKILGVIGTGDIGQEVIKIAQGFDMDVIAFDPFPKEEVEDQLGFDYEDLDEVLEESDVVTLHCPLTSENHHMISTEEFEKMNETVIINTARGGLIDTGALLEALENGNVSQAGLDVLEEESAVKEDLEIIGEEEHDMQKVVEDHILMGRDDVVITPHNAFNSKEALKRIEDQTLQNLNNRENIVN